MASDSFRMRAPARRTARHSKGSNTQRDSTIQMKSLWEPKITFCLKTVLSRYNLQPGTLKPRKRFTIPLCLAMDASPVIEADFEGINLYRKNIVAMVENVEPEPFTLFMQYLYRNTPSEAERFLIPDDYPKMMLWTECFMLAEKFKITGLKNHLTRKIKERLLEFEEKGYTCDEYMDIIQRVDNERQEVNWLREMIVDVKRLVARRERVNGISMEDELPHYEVDWPSPPNVTESSDFSDY